MLLPISCRGNGMQQGRYDALLTRVVALANPTMLKDVVQGFREGFAHRFRREVITHRIRYDFVELAFTETADTDVVDAAGLSMDHFAVDGAAYPRAPSAELNLSVYPIATPKRPHDLAALRARQ
jgi:hypothetical protein